MTGGTLLEGTMQSAPNSNRLLHTLKHNIFIAVPASVNITELAYELFGRIMQTDNLS
jgi:hypothetical protein